MHQECWQFLAGISAALQRPSELLTHKGTPRKCASHQFSVAGRQRWAQVCSLAQVNKRKTGAIWQTCRAWNSFLVFLPLLPLNYYSGASPGVWQNPYCDLLSVNSQTTSVTLENVWIDGVFMFRCCSTARQCFFFIIDLKNVCRPMQSVWLFSLNYQYFVRIFTWSTWSLIHIHLTFNTQHKHKEVAWELYTPCTRHNRSLFHTAKVRLWGNSNTACFSIGQLQAFPGKSKASVRLILWDKSS